MRLTKLHSWPLEVGFATLHSILEPPINSSHVPFVLTSVSLREDLARAEVLDVTGLEKVLHVKAMPAPRCLVQVISHGTLPPKLLQDLFTSQIVATFELTFVIDLVPE